MNSLQAAAGDFVQCAEHQTSPGQGAVDIQDTERKMRPPPAARRLQPLNLLAQHLHGGALPEDFRRGRDRVHVPVMFIYYPKSQRREFAMSSATRVDTGSRYRANAANHTSPDKIYGSQFVQAPILGRNLATTGNEDMCNLYTVRTSAAAIAAHFSAIEAAASNAGDEVYPGRPGLVVREDGGRRIMQSMGWGFPVRLKHMKPDSKPKPVNNIADLRKGFWVGLARKPQWRCLIPLTGFAEAEGRKGAMTRTWFNVKNQPIVAWGGLWRISDEWGPVYSGAMTDANEAVRPVHNRMPVLLMENEYDQWLRGSLEDLVAFQERDFPADLIEMTRTTELWAKPRSPSAGALAPEGAPGA